MDSGTMDEDALLQSIDPVYFEDEKNFKLDHLCNQLPAELTSDYLLEQKGRLTKQLTIVTQRVSELILSHQPKYVDELQRIADLQKSLNESINICSKGRSNLSYIKDGAVKNGSTIMAHYNKREALKRYLDSLTTINDLKRTVLEIHGMIVNQENIPKAIQMCKDGKALLALYQEYRCINELGLKLNKFCDCSASSEPHDCFNTQALNFFNSFHKSSLDELAMFLENELWEVVPVRSDFKLVQLKEFSFLRNIKSNQDEDDDDEDLNPELEEDFVEEVESQSSSEDEEVAQNERTNESSRPHWPSSDIHSRYSLTRTSGPTLTNSSLNVLRMIGRYIQLMKVLETISYEILMKIYNLLDYYTMVVYSRFGPERDRRPEDNKLDDKNLSPKLRLVIRSIKESLIGSQPCSAEPSSPNKHGGPTTIPQGVTNINDMLAHDIVSIDSKDDEAFRSKKSVAIESLIFLVNQLWNLQEYLESLIPADLRPKLREQFSKSNSVVPDFLKARAELSKDL